MKNISTYIISIAAGSVLFLTDTFAQDARFSQPLSMPLRYNAGIMGANSDMKFQLNYRSQWGSIEKGYVTYGFNAMVPFYLNSGKSKFDAGVSVIDDKAGAFSKLDALLALDYNLRLSEHNYFSMALTGGYVQNTLSTSGLTFDSQYITGSYSASNPNSELTLGQKSSFADVGFGMMWYMNPPRSSSALNAYAGVAGYHLNKPNTSLTGATAPLPARYAFMAGIKIMGQGKIDVLPNVRYSAQKGSHDLSAGVYIDYVLSDNIKFVAGSWYHQDAIAFLLGFEHKSFTFGYSYDAVNQSLTGTMAALNAHEISVGYKLSRLGKSDSDDKTPNVHSSPFESF